MGDTTGIGTIPTFAKKKKKKFIGKFAQLSRFKKNRYDQLDELDPSTGFGAIMTLRDWADKSMKFRTHRTGIPWDFKDRIDARIWSETMTGLDNIVHKNHTENDEITIEADETGKLFIKYMTAAVITFLLGIYFVAQGVASNVLVMVILGPLLWIGSGVLAHYGRFNNGKLKQLEDEYLMSLTKTLKIYFTKQNQSNNNFLIEYISCRNRMNCITIKLNIEIKNDINQEYNLPGENINTSDDEEIGLKIQK